MKRGDQFGKIVIKMDDKVNAKLWQSLAASHLLSKSNQRES
jgi:hypothetical protein